MTISLHDICVPPMAHTLKALSAILDKAEAHCRESGGDPAALLEARLAPDMFPLARQVQIATDHAKGSAARLSGRDVPSFEDTERSFADLKARIARTIAFTGGLAAADFADAETREIALKIGGRDMSFSGLVYLTRFALPNFYFHATTAYDILRHEGVALGKRDFIGGA